MAPGRGPRAGGVFKGQRGEHPVRRAERGRTFDKARAGPDWPLVVATTRMRPAAMGLKRRKEPAAGGDPEAPGLVPARSDASDGSTAWRRFSGFFRAHSLTALDPAQRDSMEEAGGGGGGAAAAAAGGAPAAPHPPLPPGALPPVANGATPAAPSAHGSFDGSFVGGTPRAYAHVHAHAPHDHAHHEPRISHRAEVLVEAVRRRAGPLPAPLPTTPFLPAAGRGGACAGGPSGGSGMQQHALEPACLLAPARAAPSAHPPRPLPFPPHAAPRRPRPRPPHAARAAAREQVARAAAQQLGAGHSDGHRGNHHHFRRPPPRRGAAAARCGAARWGGGGVGGGGGAGAGAGRRAAGRGPARGPGAAAGRQGRGARAARKLNPHLLPCPIPARAAHAVTGAEPYLMPLGTNPM
jgi:hypothetical protein